MSNVVTGARARFLFEGVQIGYATGFSFREGITYEEVNVLGNIQVQEHVPTAYGVSWNADVIRFVNNTWKSRDQFPRTGKDPASHLTNILNSGQLTAVIEDAPTGKIVAQLEGCRVSEKNISFPARGIVGENVSGVAIRARNESDLT